MKKLRHELRYDDATLDQVQDMLADPTFREKVCDYQRVLSRDVSITGHGAGMAVKVEQAQGTDHVPSFAKKFVGDQIPILQTEDWSDASSAALRVAMPGKPGEINGTITLTESGGGVTEVVEAEAKVAIPLVGGKLEGLISDLLVRALKAENKVGREWLAP